jgi:hypothetical protein
MRTRTDDMNGKSIEWFGKESFTKDFTRAGRKVARIVDPRSGAVIWGRNLRTACRCPPQRWRSSPTFAPPVFQSHLPRQALSNTSLSLVMRRLGANATVHGFRRATEVGKVDEVDPVSIDLRPGFTRDVSNIGHYGTGDLEVTLSQMEDLERSKPLLQQSYEAS